MPLPKTAFVEFPVEEFVVKLLRITSAQRRSKADGIPVLRDRGFRQFRSSGPSSPRNTRHGGDRSGGNPARPHAMQGREFRRL